MGGIRRLEGEEAEPVFDVALVLTWVEDDEGLYDLVEALVEQLPELEHVD